MAYGETGAPKKCVLCGFRCEQEEKHRYFSLWGPKHTLRYRSFCKKCEAKDPVGLLLGERREKLVAEKSPLEQFLEEKKKKNSGLGHEFLGKAYK